MAIFSNKTKIAIGASNLLKIVSGGYGFARYGMSFYGQGGQPTNLIKSLGIGGLWTASVLPWQLSSPWTVTIGAIAWSNQNKN